MSASADSAKLMVMRDMKLFQTEPLPGLVETNLPSRVQIGKPGYHRAHEVAFLLGLLIVAYGLDDSDAPAAVRDQHRSVHFGRMFHHAPRIHLQVRQGNEILENLIVTLWF